MNRVVDGIVETTALLALYRHAGDEITRVNHVAELAEFLAYLSPYLIPFPFPYLQLYLHA